MTRLHENAVDPVTTWFRKQDLAVPALRHELAVELPGGGLSIRTNSAGCHAYLRQRCQHLPAGAGRAADVTAEIYCLPGLTWPRVKPLEEDEQALSPEEASGFQSFRRAGVTCAWRSPALMGAVSGTKPARLRMVATTPNPKWMRSSGSGLRLKCGPRSIAYPDVFDLALCLFAEVRGLIVLHGAVLERKGRGILLTGESGSGKTTTALTLVRAGFRLLTDEYAVLWKQGRWRGKFGGVLVPPMMVRPLPSLTALERSLGSTASEKTAYRVQPGMTRSSPVRADALLRLIRPPVRSVEHRAIPMDPRDALACLMTQLLNPIRAGRFDALDAQVAAVEQARAFDVTAGTDLATLPAFVEGLLRGPTGRLESQDA
jgi:hypothetical protein